MSASVITFLKGRNEAEGTSAADEAGYLPDAVTTPRQPMMPSRLHAASAFAK